MHPSDEPVRPTSVPSTRVVPAPSFIEQAASVLAAAERPMIFVGDGVAFSGAQDELTRVAELLGAEVWEADAGEVNMSERHPLYQGMTGHMFGEHSLPILQKGDANLVVGTYIVPEVFPELGDVFAPGAKVVHVDLNAYEIAKNHPVDLGVVADPKLTLALLGEALERVLPDSKKAATRARIDQAGRDKEARHQAELEQDRAVRDAVPAEDVPLHGRARGAAHRRRRRVRRGTDELASRVALPAAIADRPVLPHPRRFARRRLPRCARREAGKPGQDGAGVQRRRRLDVHDPGVVDSGPSQHQREVRGLQQRLLPVAAAEHRPVLARTGHRAA